MNQMEIEERIKEISKSLGGSLKNLQIYPENHPLIRKTINKSFLEFSEIFSKKDEIALAIADETLVFEGTPLFHLTSSLHLFLQTLIDFQIDGLVFTRGLEEKELERFISFLHNKRGEKLTRRDVDSSFSQLEITHIHAVTPEGDDETEDLSAAKEIYENAISLVSSMMSDIRLGKIPSGEQSRTVVEDMSRMLKKNQDAMMALTMIKNYDEYTYTHSVNVAVISLSLAETLGLSDEDKVDIGIAGLLHDVGKTQVALDLIRKPSSLTLEEFEEIKQHPEEGYRILSQMDFMHPLSAKIVREHHMGFDLSGYPKVEPGYSMEPYSHIVSAADCYDALTTLRSYQKPRTPRDSLEIMTKMAGKSLDSNIVKSLIKILGIYPIGTMVRLTTGEVAVVSAQNMEDSFRPKVIILIDEKGKQVEFPIHFDLMDKDSSSGTYRKDIVTTVNPLLENSDPSRSVA
jgi:putative nucleotidyltransferase with HDIG domain